MWSFESSTPSHLLSRQRINVAFVFMKKLRHHVIGSDNIVSTEHITNRPRPDKILKYIVDPVDLRNLV